MNRATDFRHLVCAVALALCFVGLSQSHAQPAGEAAAPDLTPGRWEFTAQVGAVGYWQGGATVSLTTERGYGLSAGWRPTASRRGLVEVYVLHVPRGEHVASGKPQFTALGLGGTFMAREAERRLNPYLAGGLGLWRVDARPPVPCQPPGGVPPPPDSRCPTADHSFRDTMLPLATAGAGLYLTILPAMSLRMEGRLYAPLGEGSDSGSPRPVLAVGVSVRP